MEEGFSGGRRVCSFRVSGVRFRILRLGLYEFRVSLESGVGF